MPQKCIICGEEITAVSKEHVFPEAIGGKWTLQCVCKHCNDLLGSRIDCLLTQEPLVLLLRSKYKIPNKEKKYVDITKELKFFDSRGKRVFIQKGDGKHTPSLYIGREPEITIKDNRIVKFSGSDYNSIEKHIQRSLRKNKIEISASDIQQVLKTGKPTYIVGKINAPIYFNEFNFAPCILKIAYESAIFLLGERYIKDEYGRKIAIFLNDLMIRKYTNEGNEIKMAFQYLGLESARKEHCIQIVYNHNSGALDAIINIFGCFMFFVTISNEPAKYVPIKLPFMRIETP